MRRISPLPVVLAFVLGLAVVLGLVLADQVSPDYAHIETTSEPSPSTTWLETQPTLGHRFDEYRSAVEAQRKSKPAKRVMRGQWPWDALKDCESPGLGWDAHTGNGYEGGLQFHPQTWSAYNLPGYPPRAFMATREQQIAVAERVLHAQGWARGWPSCSLKIGAR